MSLVKRFVEVGGVEVPRFFYGTAWKEGESERLVVEALEAGFLAVDSANQRRHYFEEGVGLGVQRFLKDSGKRREDLFLQSKFTFANGQDDRKPYNDGDSYPTQVRKSLESSLRHFGSDFLDSLVLHGSFSRDGICDEDREVWQAMESLVEEGKVRFLGVSNVSLGQLDVLFSNANVKPTFVQSRCFAVAGWDFAIRKFCVDKGMLYQGFSLLTANVDVLRHPVVELLAEKYGKSVAQVVFRFCLQMGMLPLTGTSSQVHMKEDLAVFDFDLSADELRLVEGVGVSR